MSKRISDRQTNGQTQIQQQYPLVREPIFHTILVEVKVSELRPHPVAQRRMVPSMLKKIKDHFDPDALRVIDAVKYPINDVTAVWIVDGQTRWRAMMDLGYGDRVILVNLHVDCHDDRRASELFILLNTATKPGPYDLFMVEVAAEVPATVAILDMLTAHDLKLARTGTDGHVCCPTALKTVYHKDEGKSLVRTLDTIRGAWGRAAAGLEGKIIEGIGIFYASYEPDAIDMAALINRLAKYGGGASNLLGRAKGLVEIKKIALARAVAEIVRERYNASRRGTQLDPL